MFIGKWNKSVILTYVGLSLSIVGMFLCVQGEEYIKYSFILLMLAGVCDMFDGFIARKCKRDDDEKAFGVELDSLVDVVSFLIFPVVLLMTIGLRKWYHLISFILFAICGVERLGYFNISGNPEKPVEFYSGVPVTFTAIIFPLMNLFKLCFDVGILIKVMFITTISTALLFILNVKVKKPKGLAYVCFSLLAIAMTIVYAMFM